MAEPVTPEMPEYVYSHQQTLVTTGYFSCEPVDKPELPAALERLSSRPLDNFLHDYALRHILELAEQEFWPMLDACGDSGKAGIMAALWLERLLLNGENIEKSPELVRFIQDRRNLSPQLHLLLRERLQNNYCWSEAFKANINEHKALPEQIWLRERPHAGEDYAQAASRIQSMQGAMPQLWEKMRRKKREDSRKPAAETAALAYEALARAGILEGPEMRHEASLSPIALTRQWKVQGQVDVPPNEHRLGGLAWAFGRGLNLASARAGCLMEIVERSAAYAHIGKFEVYGRQKPMPLRAASARTLLEKGDRIIASGLSATEFLEEQELRWIEGEDSQGQKVFVPCQAVFLFCNLPEPNLYDSLGSTGLASGNTISEARLSAVLEALEREAHATTPFYAEDCFQIASRDERIQSLLDDYRFKGIHIQFQDISHPLGLPAYRCFVQARYGQIAQATGAGLNGQEAILAALTETPWPYVWAKPVASPSARSAGNLPLRFIEDLPNYDLGSTSVNLELVEGSLALAGRDPVYAELGASNTGFPVARAFLPHMAVISDFDEIYPPSPELILGAERKFRRKTDMNL